MSQRSSKVKRSRFRRVRPGSRKSQLGFLINPFAFSAATGSGPIDSYTSNIWGAYGLQRLLSSYSGSAIRVRRSSDSTEQDIGFSGNDLDTSALSTFVGSGTGYVVTWYDQSGLGHNFSQSTTTKQPVIFDTGVYTKEILFDGVDDQILTSASCSAVSALSAVWAGHNRIGASSNSENVLVTGSSEAIVSSNYTSGTYTSNYMGLYAACTTTSISHFNGSLSSDTDVYAVRWDRSQGAVTTENTFLKNGVAVSSVAVAGSQVSGNFTANVWYLGGSTGSYNRLAIKSLVLYEAAVSNTTIANISTALTPTPNTLGFDSYTTGLWGLYSLRKQLTSYSGSAIRVRRSSDSTEQDIGFTAGNLLDTASLLSFAGSGSAYVKTWYDQSGGGKNLSQTTAANQPRIVNAGVLDVGVVFDGSNDIMSSPNSGTPDKFTLVSKGGFNSSSGIQVIFEQSPTIGTNTGAIVYVNTGLLVLSHSRTNETINVVDSRYGSKWWSGQVIAARFDRAAASAAAKNAYFTGGALKNRTGSADIGSISGNFVAHPWYIGARSGSLYPFNGWMETLAIYEAAPTDSDIDRISRAVG